VALPSYDTLSVEFSSKSGTNEVQFTLVAVTVLRRSIVSHCSWLTQSSHLGHYILDAETVFRPFLPSHCSGGTEICHMALTFRALRAVQGRLKSVSTEWHFTLEAETDFRLYHASHCSGVNET
jgi:hypothetical protein